MGKILKFTQFSFRDLVAAVGPTVVAVAAALVLAYLLVDPSPPRYVALSTGQFNSAYEEFGKKYKDALGKHGIAVSLEGSLGSSENLARLRAGKADIAFVQSGETSEEEAKRRGMVSLGSLFTEPVWLFVRESAKVTQLTQLRGLKVNLGPEGTGTPRLFKQVLSVNGVEASELTVSALENTPATVELLEGRIDALVFASAPESPLIQMLLQTPGIQLFDFRQAEAYTRRLPYLNHVVLPQGIVDLGRNIPSQDFHLIAPTATLVAREDLHPALVDLFVQAANQVHGGAGWFQKHGEFPSAGFTEIPVHEQAQKFYKDGPPFLQRYMNFWMANMFDRMWVVVLAAGALLIPLSRIIPPLYVWRVRSRVYRWYGQLRGVEQDLAAATGPDKAEVCKSLLDRLDRIEDRVNQMSIPLSFADELYGLRSHINFVRERVRASGADPGQAVLAPAAD